LTEINLVDDYQAEAIPLVVEPRIVNWDFKLTLADDYSAIALNSDVVYSSNNSTKFKYVIMAYIQDDLGRAQDEYVLITEDGFVISLEDFQNQDEIAIVVRVK
jgi:hypothetical protein